VHSVLIGVIVKGENVSTSGVLKPYVMKIKPGKEGQLWQTHVVMSTVVSNVSNSSLSKWDFVYAMTRTWDELPIQDVWSLDRCSAKADSDNYQPCEQLPASLSQDGAKRLCDVESVLKDKGVEMKLKNRHWYNRGDKYLRAKFNIQVILGAADLKFQLQTKDRMILSNDHDAIEVKWEAPKQTSVADGGGLAVMYRERT